MTADELRAKVFAILPNLILVSKAVPDPTAGWDVYLESDKVLNGSSTSLIALPPANVHEAVLMSLKLQLGYGHLEEVRLPPGTGPEPLPRREALVVEVSQ